MEPDAAEVSVIFDIAIFEYMSNARGAAHGHKIHGIVGSHSLRALLSISCRPLIFRLDDRVRAVLAVRAAERSAGTLRPA
jgi:hypothetical protein